MITFLIILGVILIAGAILNLYTFLLMSKDKKRAIEQELRIPEKRFFKLAFYGGSLGIYWGMSKFKHKRQKWSFKWRIYAALFSNLILFSAIVYALVHFLL